MDQSHIRNFSIIAHIDHGKSTLADRILQLTDTVSARDMRDQMLDSMELERERGITIKAQAVRVHWKGHELNLIDTPGHVDFTYEVSRSLQACEGALLVVDAAQGIEAQTLANAYLAIENNLEIVPVVNKIDLPQADPDGASAEVADLIGEDPGNVLRISAKTGQGVDAVLDAIIARIPAPTGEADAPPRALIFDSSYDQYRGVVAFVRVVDGVFRPREHLRAMALGTRFEAQEIGYMSPAMRPVQELQAGEVGYVITGLKDVSELRVGDTLTAEKRAASAPLPGYKDVKPMVFAGLFPTESDDYPELRDALEKLKLNDAALFYEPETSQALGFGFRCGFLGLLHMEIVRERLEREFDLDLLVTAPNVAYRVKPLNEDWVEVHTPADLPDSFDEVEEPYIKASIIVPKEFVGQVMELQQRPARQVRPPRVSVGAARPPDVRAAARRDRPRLLRPAEVADARLRELRLRPGRLPARQPRARRHPRRRRAGRRAVAASCTATSRTSAARRLSRSCARRSRGRCSTSRSRPRSARASSPARPSRRAARTCSPSATAATSPASGSCSRSRRRGRSG